MPFGNYEELIATIEDWIGRDDFRTQVVDFILLAEAEMSARCRLRLQDKVYSDVFIADQDWIAVPDDLIEPRMLRINTDPPQTVNIVSITKFQDVQSVNAAVNPSAVMYHENRLYLATTPGSAEDFDLFYRGGFPNLSSENASNFVLEQFPMCYLYGALANSGGFLGSDERVPGWTQHAQLWYEELRKSESKARTGGGRLRVRPDIGTGGSVAGGIRRSNA